MSRQKSTHEIKVLCFPAEATPVADPKHWAIHDVVAKLIQPDRGESDGTALSNGVPSFLSQSWQNQPYFKAPGHIDANLTSISFSNSASEAATGAQEGVAFITLRPREFPVHCAIGDGVFNGPFGSGDYSALAWGAKRGNSWAQAVPDGYDRSFIFHAAQTPDDHVRAVLHLPLAGNQAFRIDHIFEGSAVNQTKPVAHRLSWDNDQKSLLWKEGAPVSYQVRQGIEWLQVRQLEGAPVFSKDYAGTETVWLLRIAGRLVIYLKSAGGGMTRHEIVGSEVPNAQGAPQLKLKAVSWEAGGLAVQSFGTMVKTGLALLYYLDDDTPTADNPTPEPVPRTGSFGRFKPLPYRPNTPLLGVGRAAGYQPLGTGVAVATQDSGTGVLYDCALVADALGIEVPAVSMVAAQLIAPYTVQSPEPLDITSAVESADIREAEPGTLPGAQGTIKLSRVQLEVLGEAAGVNWQNYVAQYHRIEFWGRWKYDDGTYDEWARFPVEYIYNDTRDSEFLQWGGTLDVRDPIIRLTKPAALIDGRYAPYDLLWAEQAPAPLFRAQIVQRIVEIELGADMAAKLNGNGDPLRYFPKGALPVLSQSDDRPGWFTGITPPSTSFPVMVPNWGGDALSEINNLAKDEVGAFFFAPDPDGSGEIVPMYVYYYTYLKLSGRPEITLPDAVYSSGDENLLVSRLSVLKKPETDANRAQVWVQVPNLDTSKFQPAPIVAQAQLDSTDPRAADHSWPRTLLVRDKPALYYAQGLGAFLLAETVMSLYRLNQFRWPTATLDRGEQSIRWGDVVKFKTQKEATTSDGDQSDATLGLDYTQTGTKFRVLSVTHRIDRRPNAQKQFETTLDCVSINLLGF